MPLSRRRRRSRSGLWAGLFLTVALAGCATVTGLDVRSRIPDDPAQAWRPPHEALPAAPPAAPAVVLPDDLLMARNEWTLTDIVDLALRNNPLTRASWASALAASANLGTKQGAYWPQIGASAGYQRSQNSVGTQPPTTLTSFTPAVALNAVLFDFGKRAGTVEQARQSLYQANWSHNQTIQDVALTVEQTYYQYLSTHALHEAAAQAVEEATANVDAAEQRRSAGLATLADVLQARSNLAQQKLTEQTLAGQIQTVRGSLATAMGLSPTVDYDVGFLPGTPPADSVATAVEDLIVDAQTYRPALAAARASVLAARAHVGAVKGQGRPEITVQGSVARRYYDGFDQTRDTYLAGVFLNLPLFTGFSHVNDVRQAQAEEALAESRLETLRSSVELNVWQGYYDLRTATQRLQTAREFLDSATQSHDVATERYRSGLDSILDLLAAQTTLEDARAQDVQARTDWYLAVASLAHATGRLGTSPPVATIRPGSDTTQDGAR